MKTKGNSVRLVLGNDMKLNEVINMVVLTLVGRILGRRFNEANIVCWMKKMWVPLLGSVLSFYFFARGWMAFMFRIGSNAKNILSTVWMWNHSPIMLKKWSPSFDARFERMETIPIWVKLPGLPIEYW